MAEHVSGACADLTCYLTWHLRRAWAPLTFTGQEPPQQGNPVTPLPPLDGRQAKGYTSTTRLGSPAAASAACWSTWPPLTRNQVRYTGTDVTIAMLAQPTSVSSGGHIC